MLVVVLAAALVVAACGSGAARATRPVPETPAATPTAVPGASPARPARARGPVAVVRVVDGDTVVVAPATKLRLIGMDTPETVDPRRPVQCFGREASARAHELLDGTAVWIEYDASQGRFDRYGRTLAYVWLADGRLFEQVMIGEGYAHEYTYDLPYRYQDLLIGAERAARNTDRGLWSPETCHGDTTVAAPR